MKNQENVLASPVLESRHDYLEGIARRRSARPAMSKAMPMHTHSMMRFQVVHLGLLVGREYLVKRSLRLGMGHDHLRVQAANRVRGLLNPRGIVLLDCRLETVMGRAHLIMRGFGVIGDLAKDCRRLLLLLRSERQLLGQKINAMLRHLRRVRRVSVLRHDDNACQGKKCSYFQEGCSHWFVSPLNMRK